MSDQLWEQACIRPPSIGDIAVAIVSDEVIVGWVKGIPPEARAPQQNAEDESHTVTVLIDWLKGEANVNTFHVLTADAAKFTGLVSQLFGERFHLIQQAQEAVERNLFWRTN